MTTATLPIQPSFLKKNLFLGITPALLFVIAIMALSFGLHMVNIEAIGDANSYYTAAVKSMLQSWSNFFFAAAEPGGSVSVDKPPLGLWIEAAFAYFLGVSGFSVSLPNILAGVLSIPLLYNMVKKYAGELAGLIAAFVMAFTPVFVATNRNNTMDGMLVFFLLMAAWAFIKATESGKLRWLLLGAFILGLGFNIKMLQAFLPLPAFYALYFFGSKEGWLRKIVNLGSATVFLAAVSLSWAIAVDLTPADQRPYIGSSGDNTVMGLILGHNGGSRLFGGGGPQGDGPQDGQTPPTAPNADQPADQASQPQQNPTNGQPQPANAGGPPQEALDACEGLSRGEACTFDMSFGTVNGSCIIPLNSSELACAPQGLNPQNGQPPRQGPPQEALDACSNSSQGDACSFTLQNGNTINGSCITPPNSNELACAPQGMNPQQNGQGPVAAPGNLGDGGATQFNQETGEPGVFRFFTNPLSKQMSWLLPFALISVALALFAGKIRLPLESAVHKALIIWGGWLLTCVAFFSTVSGIFHSYYAIMLAPALGAMVGIGFAQLWNWGRDKKWIDLVLIASALVTLAFQLFASYQYGEQSRWMLVAMILFVLGSASMLILKRTAYLILLVSMLIIPIYWTAMTVVTNGNRSLPTAYTGGNQQNGLNTPRPQDDRGPGVNANDGMLAYLESNTQGMKYLAAVPSSQQGSSWVIATGRPVLYMGGFGGGDDVVSAEDLAELVANGELRYVLYGGDRGNKEDIATWLANSCTVVTEFSTTSSAQNQPDGQNQVQGPGGGGPSQASTLYMCE